MCNVTVVMLLRCNGNGYDVVRIDADVEEKWKDGYSGCGYSLNDY